ncbi:hypothetical protein [Streptoalloteichus tenebrarius]|nr:hypothetical protein [Streptoalloteichus tenebrarius]
MAHDPDRRQWAYGAWWTPATEDSDPQLLNPQPDPPSDAEQK